MHIPFSQTHYFSKLMLDYIEQKKSLRQFYQYNRTIETIPQIVADKKNENIDRKKLADTIRKQYQNNAIQNENIQAQIQALENENTFCVVTAHQLNIFGGPLYFIYKIAQTISTCKQLNDKNPNFHFVPIYWLGSEDHDFEEINHIYLYNKKIEWNDKQHGATGEYQPQSILPLIEEIKTIVGKQPFADELISIFVKAYQQNTLTHATRFLVNALFGKYGLLVVDGNDADFKQALIPIFKDELVNQQTHQLVTKQSEALEAQGYIQQAFPRAINLFYLTKNKRERIELDKKSKQYKILNSGISFSKDEIINELHQHPERFSPNVILRPLFQQKILPAVAYIGGGGELAYWLQLKTTFEYYKVNFPQLILRNSALLVDDSTKNKIEKLDFSVEDFFKDIEQLKKDFVTQHNDEDIDVSTIKNEIQLQYNSLQKIAEQIDASLINSVGAELQKTLNNIDNLQKRFMRALKQKNEVELNRIEKIKSQLFPNLSLQERVENFSAYYAVFGQQFIDDLIEKFDVYNKQFLLIQLNK
ncbi:MAG: bacillithiol biosynthesis cysteine-adding enzyme BshC [Chitinophagales bacterium]